MLAPLKGREFENKLPSDSYIPLHIGSNLNSKVTQFYIIGASKWLDEQLQTA